MGRSMTFIVLTEAQADHVRGPTGANAALAPVALASGTQWVLPVAVLSDPAHSEHHTYLSALTQRTVADNEWPVQEEPE